MLGSKKTGNSVAGGTTLVSHDTVVVGDIHFTGNLDVEGQVQGNIIAQPEKEALVRVVDKGSVEGDIRAPCIVINGSVEGDVHSAQHLELAPKARVTGNVFYTMLEMAVGSEVNGRLMHVPSAESGKQKKLDPSVGVSEAKPSAKAEKAAIAKVD